MELFSEQKNKSFQNYLLHAHIDVSSMLINLSVWSLTAKFLMEDILWLMAEIKQLNFSKIFLSLFQEELLQIDFLYIWMHTPSTIQYVHLDLHKLWLLGVKMKDITSTCSNLQEPTMDIHAAPQEKAVKQQRLNFKRMISAKWAVKML